MGVVDWAKKQPILAGCVGCLGCGGLTGLGLLAGLALFAGQCQSAMGVNLQGALADGASAGFQASFFIDNGHTTITLLPQSVGGVGPVTPREVTCDEVARILQPHLLGTVESLTVETGSIRIVGGRAALVPLTCEWSGSPSPTERGELQRTEHPAQVLQQP